MISSKLIVSWPTFLVINWSILVIFSIFQMLHYGLTSQEEFKWWHVLKPCLNSKNTSLKATIKLKVESNCGKKIPENKLW
jgi:hypothetical protein